MIQYREIASCQAPMSLLLEADPSQECILKYLKYSQCFAVLKDSLIIGVCVVKVLNCGSAEIFNLVVAPAFQKQGIGKKFLKYVLNQLAKKGIESVKLGTGTFGYQLNFYQQLGFHVDSVVSNFFLENYSEPIFENGIQHKDMIRLVCQLKNKEF
ncbi:GNAT family N-acetyltransferase [Psychromonas ossibalaenae]|uniref:GNAT family N-acetyltransferase n=1 Tax=Psychromonas ossibalaenae TaxID=444922 RepID=UPI00036B71CA|nr:GNAT family N-acetyltransferase [Psychromonas ossibalaenae]